MLVEESLRDFAHLLPQLLPVILALADFVAEIPNGGGHCERKRPLGDELVYHGFNEQVGYHGFSLRKMLMAEYTLTPAVRIASAWSGAIRTPKTVRRLMIPRHVDGSSKRARMYFIGDVG